MSRLSPRHEHTVSTSFPEPGETEAVRDVTRVITLIVSTTALYPTRRRFALERYLGIVALVAALTAGASLVLVGSAAAFDALDKVSVPGLLVACAGAGALALLHASIVFGVAAFAWRDQR